MPKRVITASFLRDLILDETFDKATRTQGLILSDLIVEGSLRLSGARITRNITILSSEFLGEVDFSDATIIGNVSFARSDLVGGVYLGRTHIDGSLTLGEPSDGGTHPERNRGGSKVYCVAGSGARIDGEVTIEGVDVTDGIDFSMSHIIGQFSVVRTNAAYISLYSANFDNQLIIVDDDVSIDDNFSTGKESDVRRSVNRYENALNLYSIRAKQSVYLNRSAFDRRISMESAIIDGGLNLIGAQLASVNAQGARIAGEVQIGTLQPGFNRNLGASWTKDAELDLRWASINSIVAPEFLEAWPSRLRLANFQLKSFSPDYCKKGQSCAHQPTWFVHWLNLDHDSSERVLQSYQMIADMLQTRGDKEEAASVGLARGDKAIAADSDSSSLLSYVGRILYRWTVGYGYYPQWSIYWVIGLTLLGAAVYGSARTRPNEVNSIAYSFDLLIPLVKLDEDHFKIRLSGWRVYYFYLHRLAGWLLGSFLLATIGGLNLGK